MGNFVCKFCFIAQVRSLNSSKSYEEGLNFQVLFVIQLLKIYFYKKNSIGGFRFVVFRSYSFRIGNSFTFKELNV
jgi:hypothetical protein